MEKAPRDVIGVVIVIDEFVMSAVVGGPSQSRALKRSRPEEQGIELHERIRLEG